MVRDLVLSGVSVEKANIIANGAGLTGCKARDFVRDHREKIGDITEYQQLKLFERIYPDYEERTKGNYNRWVGLVSGAKKWDNLSLPVRNVLIDFVYNGYTKSARPMLAGSNDDINELITYIKRTPVLMNDEPGRNRIKYLESTK